MWIFFIILISPVNIDFSILSSCYLLNHTKWWYSSYWTNCHWCRTNKYTTNTSLCLTRSYIKIDNCPTLTVNMWKKKRYLITIKRRLLSRKRKLNREKQLNGMISWSAYKNLKQGENQWFCARYCCKPPWWIGLLVLILVTWLPW